MSKLRFKSGHLDHRDGHVVPARFYYSEDEAAPQDRAQIDAEHHATWVEADGAVGIRRGGTISVGASAAYSANYSNLDWGN